MRRRDSRCEKCSPEITTISVSPDSGVTTSTLLECLATAEDENDDAISISYVWTDSEGIELGSDGELQLTPDVTSPNDEITCTATVSDGSVDVSASIAINVENTAPEVTTVNISACNS